MNSIIGGSPSTGSSLLRQILNRHSAIFCGPETYLFSHPILYTTWNQNKSLINPKWYNFRRKFNDNGLFLHQKINLQNGELAIPRNKINKIISESSDLLTCAKELFKFPLIKYNKHFWIEKSPANSFCFSLFINHFPQGKMIHTIRHPLDAIASIYNRTQNLYYACATYLFHFNHAIKECNHPNYFQIKYEDLLRQPKVELTNLLQFINLEFEEAMLHSGNKHMDEAEKLDSWQYAEVDEIRIPKQSTFQKLVPADQRLILEGCALIYMTDKKMPFELITEVAQYCQYEIAVFPINNNIATRSRLIQEQKDFLTKRKKLGLTIMTNEFPIKIN